VESGVAVGRVPEVIDFMAFLAEAFDHFGVIRISPAGCDVNSGHSVNVQRLQSHLQWFFRNLVETGSLCLPQYKVIDDE
jgi:hypothetical protein